MKKGSIASTIAHDSHNVVAVGTSDHEIAALMNRLVKQGGGIGAGCDGDYQIMSLPFAGLMTDEPVDVVAGKYHHLQKIAKDFGSGLTAPFMTLSFMSLLVIPSLKLSDMGLFDVEKFSFVDLFE